MARRELQELAELDRRFSVGSSGTAKASSSASLRPPYRYDSSLSSTSSGFLPGRSVPYGLYNRPPGALYQGYSRPVGGSALAPVLSSSSRLSQAKDSSGRNSKFASFHRSMSSLNKSFIRKCVNTTDSDCGDPGSSLVPVSLNYVSHTLKIILKHEENDPSQNLLHLLDDIEASILQLSMEALSIRAKHDLLYSMQNKGTGVTTVATIPETPSAVFSTRMETNAQAGSSYSSTQSLTNLAQSQSYSFKPITSDVKWPDTPLAGKETSQRSSASDSDNSFSRKRGRTDNPVPADSQENPVFRNPNAGTSLGTPLSIGIGGPTIPIKLTFDAPNDAPKQTTPTSATATNVVPATTTSSSEVKAPAQTGFNFGMGNKPFGGFSTTAPTTESNNNLIKIPSTTSFTNSKPTPSTPFHLPPPISTSTPMPASTEPPKPDFGTGFFSNPAPTANHVGAKDDNDDEEDSTPPVNEFKQVEETDVIYETRVKIFEKADGTYKDLGLGKLYVKDHAKGHHLFVRAENNLGTLLVNMIMTDKIPLSRNKNNVVTVDPIGNKGKARWLLIRVKTEELASALLAKLEELKSKKRVNNNNNSKTSS